MIAATELDETDMATAAKFKTQYSTDLSQFCFDPDFVRDPESSSRVSAEDMLKGLLLPTSGEVMQVLQPLVCYSVTLTEEDVELFAEVFPKYSFQVGKEYLATRDGNSRLDGLFFGNEQGYEFEPIPFVKLSKDQIKDRSFMAMLPLVLNESRANMSQYDKARAYVEYYEALFERLKTENRDSTEEEVKQVAREEFLALVANTSSSILESALLIVDNQEVNPRLVEYLDKGQISLSNVKLLLSKINSYVKEGASVDAVLDIADERAKQRSSFVEIPHESGESFLYPHLNSEDIKFAIDHFAQIRADKKAQAKLLQEQDNVPEFLTQKVEEEGLSPDFAVKLLKIAEPANIPVEDLLEEVYEVAADKYGKSVEEISPEELKAPLINKAKSAYLKKQSDAKKQLEMPSEEVNGDAEGNVEAPATKSKAKAEFTAEDYEEQSIALIEQLKNITWEDYILSADHPDVAAQYGNLGKILKLISRLSSTQG